MLTDEIANILVSKTLPKIDLSEAAKDRLKRDSERDGDVSTEPTEQDEKTGDMTDQPSLSKRILYWNDLLQQIVRENSSDILGYLGIFAPHFLTNELREIQEGAYFSTGFVASPKRLYSNQLLHRSRKQTPYAFGASAILLSKPYDLSDRPPIVDLGMFDERAQGMPLIIETGTSHYFSAPNLTNATATCWAETTQNGTWDVLSAAHPFNWINRGQNVSFDGGLTGNVDAVANYPIDGALLSINVNPPANPLRLTPEPNPQPNERFEFDGMKSKIVSGKVATVSVLAGVTSSMEPARVRLDNGGQPGDSGSLVRSLDTGNGLGIYSGVIKTPGQTYNISQGLDQVANVFSINLWE